MCESGLMCWRVRRYGVTWSDSDYSTTILYTGGCCHIAFAHTMAILSPLSAHSPCIPSSQTLLILSDFLSSPQSSLSC